MDAKARKACAAIVGQHNQDAKCLAGIWSELRAFLAGHSEESGRLSIRYDGEAESRVVDWRSLDTVCASWAAPALLLDATLPDASLLEPVVGHRVEVKADITARWSPHVKVRQILNAPVTARKLGIIGTDEEADPEAAGSPKRVITDLLRVIRLRAALVWPRVIVVIGPMRLVEVLKERPTRKRRDCALRRRGRHRPLGDRRRTDLRRSPAARPRHRRTIGRHHHRHGAQRHPAEPQRR